MKNEKVLEFENFLHGCHTRLKELHFSAQTISFHRIIEDFDNSLSDFDDNIMEDSQSIFGFIEPGEINPTLPEAKDIENLLIEIRNRLAEFEDYMDNATMWTGVKNCCDDFWHTINKTIYLIKIAKKEI